MTKTADLKEFEEMLKGNKPQITMPPKQNTTVGQQPIVNQKQNPNERVIQVIKNLVLSIPSDSSGCGHIRNIFPMTYMNSILGKSKKFMSIISPEFIFQEDILARCKSIFFQRQMSPQHLKVVKMYKDHQHRLKYKMIWEIDDLIWGHNELQGGTKDDGVPSYNFGSASVTEEVKQCSLEIMNLMDHITVSTQFLADYIRNNLKVKVPITVIKNSVSTFFWGKEQKQITEPIKKPRVIYTGSPTHYSNEKRLLGDFENAWKDWVIKNVKSDKISFVVLGGLPWFFEEIKDKIKVLNWVDSFGYHNLVKEQKADFGIMPLVANNFNRCKSDLKAIEHYIDGVVSIGTIFSDGTPSPYDYNPLKVYDNCTVEDIDNIFWEHCSVDKYNSVLKQQYHKLKTEGRITESPEYINNFLSVLLG